MKHAYLFYFTGTGNTKRSCEIAAEEIDKAGTSVRLIDISCEDFLPVFKPEDLVILAFPVLGFSAPKTMCDFVKRLPVSSGNSLHVLCVCGAVVSGEQVSPGYSGMSSYHLFSVLGKKGYIPSGAADVSYPENWTQVINPPGKDRSAAAIASGDSETRAFAQDVITGKGRFLKRGIVARSLGRLCALVFRNLACILLGRLFVADESCTACGLCVKTCPARAIRMRGKKPAWNMNCVACNRCINVCPSASIQTSFLRLFWVVVVNIAVLVLAYPLAGVLITIYIPGLPLLLIVLLQIVFGTGLFLFFSVLQAGPLDFLLQVLERIPGIRKLFLLSFTRRFRRYLAPGFKPEIPD